MVYRITSIATLLAALVGYSFHAAASNGQYPSYQVASYKFKSVQGGLLMASAQETKNTKKVSENNGSIILIGASYAAGLNSETIAGRKLINKGIGGERSFESLARLNRDVIALKPDAVILWGFINDIFRSDREKINLAVERIKSSYIEMIDQARANDIIPIVATEVTMSLRAGIKEWAMSLVASILGKTSYQEYVNGHVMNVNQWLKDHAKKKDIILLDFQALLADDSGIMRKKEYSQKDGSHISDKGYRIIAEYIQQNVKTLE